MTDLSRAILESYGRPPLARRAYLSLRLRRAGYDRLLPLFPPSGTVADLGAGDGLLAQLLARARGLRVLAVEADPARAARIGASSAGLPVDVACARMEEVPLPPLDGAALVDVAHYLDGTAQERLLDRLADALRPGGVLVLRDPDAGAGARFAVTRLHERVFLTAGFTRGGFGRYRSGEEWADLLSARGLEPELLPLPPRSPYADRVVTGRKP